MVNRTRLVSGAAALLIALAWSGAASAQSETYVPADPRPLGGWVSDGAGILDGRVEDINRHISALEQETGVEIGVVTLSTIGDEVPRDFATDLFNHWGVGKQGQDNGVLVVHVLDQRRVEIEVGYGLESTLTDARSKWIIDDVTIPFFKAGSFADGHYETVRAIARLVRQPNLKRARLTVGQESRPGDRVNQPSATPQPAAGLPLPTPRGPLAEEGKLLTGVSLGVWLIWTLLFLVFARTWDPLHAWTTYKMGRFLEYPAAGGVSAGGAMLLGHDLGLPLAALSLIGPGAALGWRTLVLRHFRNKPRICDACQQTTSRLSESDDDAHLEAGQITEEEVGSMDYDVWSCSCGWTRTDPYQMSGSFSACGSCSYRTYRQTGSEVVSEATYTSTGQRRVTHTCAHCGRSDVTYETIPVKQRPSDSSSSSGFSSGGGSSGGSWGGGSSGGGGAGGSY